MRSMYLWASLSLACLSLVGCGPLTFAVGYSMGDQHLTPRVVQADGGWTIERVAIVDVSGLIFDGNKPGLLREGENPVSLFQEKLDAAASDSAVKAVVLRINSPGGTVTASDIMYHQVLRFKEQTHKPVVVLMMDITASGGYYLACSGDRIVAQPTTITGSIGVIMQTVSVKPLLDRWGIMTEAIVSGPNKEVGSPLIVMTDEHRRILRGLVDDFYARFVGVVKAARPNVPADKWATLTDGRVMSGTQAAAAGLVDQVGDLQDAFALAKEMAHVKKASLIIYHRPMEYVGSAYAHSSVEASAGTQFNMAQINLGDPGSGGLGLMEQAPGFYYLWQPQLP